MPHRGNEELPVPRAKPPAPEPEPREARPRAMRPRPVAQASNTTARAAPQGRSPQTVFVFQGGGALGAYQAGVAEALQAAGIAPDWLVGTSIGAINAALLAGNRPADRLARLRGFWARVTTPSPPVPLPAPWAPWLATARTWQTLWTGIPGFFHLRVPPNWDLMRERPLNELGFYDTSPLRETLREFIDFGYLNDGHTRLTLCAVDVASGELAMFDNRRSGGEPIGPEHIMASGALPPGFAPVAIGGRSYWDGGVYSNTPLDIVLDDAERRDTLAFVVDLWDATEEAPRSLGGALRRVKDIQYASRIVEHIDDHARLQNLRRALRRVGERLDDATQADPQVRALLALGCDSAIDIVHLVMQALPGEDSFRDIDFSRETLQARWSAGLADGRRVLQQPGWLEPPPAHVGMRVHTLPQLRG